MNDSTKFVVELISLSGCIWLIFCFYSIFSIKRFIVKRYEEETNLTDTIFFKEHFTFYKYQPEFFASGLYATHLLMCVWGWWFYGKRKIFRDIASPDVITRHFTASEIRRTKRVVILGGVVMVHAFIYYLFKFVAN